MGKSKSRFTLMEKEEIVRVAFSSPRNIKATARLYGVDPQNIRYWAKSISAARSALSPSTFKKAKSRLSLHQGKSAKHHGCDDELHEFMQNLRQQQHKVTVRLMCAEYKRINADDSEVSNYVIRRRIYRWMRRKKVSLRRVTHKAQNTVHHVEAMRDWVRYVLGQIEMLGIPYENVANFDETNLDFNVDGGQTLNTKGAKTVGVKGAKSSDRATAMIGVSMMGECFTPYIVYKGTQNKTTGRIWREFNSPNFTYPPEQEYAVQERAWMDETKMLDWVERIWKPWAATKKGTTYLLMDEFASHMTAKVKLAIYACDSEIDFIIAGYTSKLQVLDVGLNRPYKDEYRRQFEQFMVTSNTAKPHRQDVANWAWNAWKTVNTSMILNTWRRVIAFGDEEEADEEEMIYESDDDEEIVYMDELVYPEVDET